MSAAAKISEFLGKSNNRRIVAGVLLVSLGVHLLAGLGAAIWVIARHFEKPEAIFESRRVVTLTPKIIDPKMASAEFEAAMSKPALDQKIASVREADFALPDVPKLDVQTKVDFDPSLLANSQIDAAALGFGAATGGGGGGVGFSFFGVKASGTKIVFLIDISGSMVKANVENYLAVEKEVENALNQIQSPATFNVLTFAEGGQKYQPRLRPAQTFEVERAMSWLNSQSPVPERLRHGNERVDWGGTKWSGTELHAALVLAFELEPDVIVILSDGEPTFKSRLLPKLGNGQTVDSTAKLLEWVREQQSKLPSPAVINTIAYKGDAGTKFMKPLAEQNNGVMRVIN